MTTGRTEASEEDSMAESASRSGSDTGSQTLQDIDGQQWGEPPEDASYLVRRCHELRQVSLSSLEIEDLRILLGQQIGVPVLVPQALGVLTDDPLAEGDFYPGDLLAAVLRLADGYWQSHPDQRAAVAEIAGRVDTSADDTADTDLPGLIAYFLEPNPGGEVRPS
jgi:hypothetical protein